MLQLIFTTVYNYYIKLDLTNLQSVYNHETCFVRNNHETRFVRNKFCQFLTKFSERIKISKNSYLEISIPKFARLCARKILIYLNLYKSKWVLARSFILTWGSPFKVFKVLWVRRLYKSSATIEFLKNKVVQWSLFRHWSEKKQ